MGLVVVRVRAGSGILYCFACFDILHSEQSYANVDPNTQKVFGVIPFIQLRNNT